LYLEAEYKNKHKRNPEGRRAIQPAVPSAEEEEEEETSVVVVVVGVLEPL
jgi:hypothetical protein